MSFAVRRLAIASRTAASSTVPRAAFSTGARLNKTPTETVKDGLKKVDRVVSDKLVDGIDVAANVGQKVKEVGSEVTSGETTGKTQQYTNEASGKASELAGAAKGKAYEMAGQVKGKTAELKGQAQGQAEQGKRNM